MSNGPLKNVFDLDLGDRRPVPTTPAAATEQDDSENNRLVDEPGEVKVKKTLYIPADAMRWVERQIQRRRYQTIANVFLALYEAHHDTLEPKQDTVGGGRLPAIRTRTTNRRAHRSVEQPRTPQLTIYPTYWEHLRAEAERLHMSVSEMFTRLIERGMQADT